MWTVWASHVQLPIPTRSKGDRNCKADYDGLFRDGVEPRQLKVSTTWQVGRRARASVGRHWERQDISVIQNGEGGSVDSRRVCGSQVCPWGYSALSGRGGETASGGGQQGGKSCCGPRPTRASITRVGPTRAASWREEVRALQW